MPFTGQDVDADHGDKIPQPLPLGAKAAPAGIHVRITATDRSRKTTAAVLLRGRALLAIFARTKKKGA